MKKVLLCMVVVGALAAGAGEISVDARKSPRDLSQAKIEVILPPSSPLSEWDVMWQKPMQTVPPPLDPFAWEAPPAVLASIPLGNRTNGWKLNLVVVSSMGENH